MSEVIDVNKRHPRRQEQDSASANHYLRMRTALIRLVDDVEMVRDAEIHQFYG